MNKKVKKYWDEFWQRTTVTYLPSNLVETLSIDTKNIMSAVAFL